MFLLSSSMALADYFSLVPKELLVSSMGPPNCCCRAEIPNAVGSCPNLFVVENDHPTTPSLMALDTTSFLDFAPSDIID